MIKLNEHSKRKGVLLSENNDKDIEIKNRHIGKSKKTFRDREKEEKHLDFKRI